MSLWVVAVGNQFDGTHLFGPFATPESALAWAESIGDVWQLVEVEEPA